ncbi:mitochondrial carrier domain-containing protein [Talaromyces proteolyticus]|uniref:Mitochondrial carrier domain-containing protein n=1 Tax=Talaromyces proteolyticus TaxID=1131652 RepID=A0AAD4KNM7_9EURO|nr:mitochondrial carrier domain-containing protein [Talaromyces proteolyticus]KAH8693235.1 mitochondrial carrier domain-containing protein [Talaromyces proteolyticus]
MPNSNTDIWVAGAIAAFTIDFVVYPLDTLKTRIQSPQYRNLYIDAATGGVRRGVLFKGLYQGIWSVVVATIPSSGAFFTTYEGVKYTLNSTSKLSSDHPGRDLLPFRHSLPTPAVNGIASSAAECVSCFILTPAEVLKQNAQMVSTSTSMTASNHESESQEEGRAGGKEKKNMNATMRALSKFRDHPIQLWRGYGALVARNLPFTAMHFPLFEHLREHISKIWQEKRRDGSEIGEIAERAVITAFSAGIAGGFAAVVTTPIDVVKTRIMLAAGKQNEDSINNKASTKGNRMGVVTVGREIYTKEGVNGLFKGGALRGGWTAIGLGLYLSVYESGRMYLEKRREIKDKRKQGITLV